LKTKTQQLIEQFGGNWKFNRHARWWEDGNRRVCKVGYVDQWGDLQPSCGEYWMYSNETPKRVYFGGQQC